jgi:hypothetical protein
MSSKKTSTIQPLFLFPPAPWWVYASQFSCVCISKDERWQKQSLRSQIHIGTPSGPLLLSVPTRKKSRVTISDVVIAQEEKWHLQWWKSLKTSYNNSPYFEFYADDLKRLLEKYSTENSLLSELSLEALTWTSTKLGLTMELDFVETHGKTDSFPILDLGYYPQVFEAEVGFLPHLSILDVLFNLGPESGSFILQQHP